MYKLQDILESTLRDIFSDNSMLEDTDEYASRVQRMIPEIADEVADSLLASIKRDSITGQRIRRKSRRRFEAKLMKHWKKPLQLLELFIELAREAGIDFNEEFRAEAIATKDAVFEALIRLHARACQTSSEILTLLQAGYADGAHARWRSLHEISVVCSFIQQYGQEIAERYLNHEVMQRYRLAESYQKHHKEIGYPQMSSEGLEEVKSRRDQLVGKYGKNFEKDYGWAESVLGGVNPSIREIEAHANMDHLRPFYKMASDNEHPTAHGLYFKLGLSQWNRNTLLAGPSNLGLADPGHSTAISLNVVASVLLLTKSTMDCVVVAKVLSRLVDEIGDEFLKAHREAEAITELQINGTK